MSDQFADDVRWAVRINHVQLGVSVDLESLQELLAEGWEPFAVTWDDNAWDYHLRRRIDGSGA